VARVCAWSQRVKRQGRLCSRTRADRAGSTRSDGWRQWWRWLVRGELLLLLLLVLPQHEPKALQ
jgi:hypothetical protein